ncbi:hypothetical protein E2562_037768 [Oryza meyeriana var. granulata]|uniref:Uncharacterized protein n=1 Tax=Oryza meyeriana var. granulata TaxID=110450 RepID=A0A6G1C263_9ORYZ|nr:hypothetical protein E2562_037768 [Oryza meyeriana var. granulata]
MECSASAKYVEAWGCMEIMLGGCCPNSGAIPKLAAANPELQGGSSLAVSNMEVAKPAQEKLGLGES